MKTIYSICLMALITFSACESWLDVAPSSQVREDEQFSSETGFQQALLGCYIGMADDMLYGTNLSWLVPDILAQTYHTFLPSAGKDYYFQNYAYTSSRTSGTVEEIWKQAYNVIANANNALKFIETNKSVLHPINYALIKGELLAVRAYMHFELLRLYGYGDLANRADKGTRLTIPYVTVMSKEMTEQSTYSEAIALLVADLEEAVELLELDPITGEHPAEYYLVVNTEGFYDNRQARLNYYAAQALLARVYMWEGSPESLARAGALATGLIEMNEERGLFPWVVNNLDANAGLFPERLFSLNTWNLLVKARDHFMWTFDEIHYNALYITAPDLRKIYEVDEGIGSVDVRYGKLYYTNQSDQCIPIKIIPFNVTQDAEYYNWISMIRLPELYYMAAECAGTGATPDLPRAKQLIREVRLTRGVVADFTCDDRASLLAELQKEYRKEFVSEGVLFYFYKRTGQVAIPKASGDLVEMTDARYTFPYPDFEIQSGRVQ